MISPSDLDKEDEDYEPFEEDDDDDYRPGKKRRPKRKRKQPARPAVQKTSPSQFQFVAEIPIEFDVEPAADDQEPPKKEVEEEKPRPTLTVKSLATLTNKKEEENESSEIPKKKPRKMITPQRSRTEAVKKSEPTPTVVNSSSNNGTTDKDPLALTDSANNIPKVTPSNAVNRFPCGFCDTVFTDISFLDRHHKRCKTKRTQESISLAQQGPVNITKPLPAYTPSLSGRFMYTCDKCPFSTKNPEHLKYHRPIHNDEQYFSCDQCMFSCRDFQQLDKHKQVHSGNNAYANAIAANAVKTEENTSATTQESNNVDESNTATDEAATSVTTPLASNATNDKPEESGIMYTCDQCSYVTSRHGYLIMHKKIHVRDQPYQCVDCGYKCSRLAYFKKHRATHGVTDDTLISCDRCSFTTSSQNVLEAHKQCHKV